MSAIFWGAWLTYMVCLAASAYYQRDTPGWVKWTSGVSALVIAASTAFGLYLDWGTR